MKHVIYNVGNVHVRSYANLVLLQRVYAQLEQRRWLKERKKFLLAQLKQHGKLTCHYCGKDDLKLKSVKCHEQATVDHFVPKSKGGNAWSHDNFVVSCNNCNQKKASKDATEFMCSRYVTNKRLHP